MDGPATRLAEHQVYRYVHGSWQPHKLSKAKVPTTTAPSNTTSSVSTEPHTVSLSVVTYNVLFDQHNSEKIFTVERCATRLVL